jgi:membrane-associated phospholipid phosphatase
MFSLTVPLKEGGISTTITTNQMRAVLKSKCGKNIGLWLVLLTASMSVHAQNTDINILKSINPDPPVSGYWKFTSASTYFVSAGIPITAFIIGAVRHDPHLKETAYETFGSVAVELIISEAVKMGLNRQRPAEKYPTEIFPYRDVHGRSFPSGHTSLAFATAASLSLQCREWWVVVPAYAWATSVGYSRMYLGVHYPSDILGGAAAGIGSAYLSHWLNHKLFDKKVLHQVDN